MAAPRLEQLVSRLLMARHEAYLFDHLDESPPALVLTLRPWRGPWTADLAPPLGTLLLEVGSGAPEQVVVRSWLDSEAEEPAHEVRVPPSTVRAAWLERTVVEFVERLLARA
jgi:hypothetical protein